MDVRPECRLAVASSGEKVTARLQEEVMLRYAVIFFIVALIAGVFGYTGIAAGSAEIAKVLFLIFLVIFLATLLISAFR
jgi:uncharacterized membrane protein YtjA (UPF0391 family)